MSTDDTTQTDDIEDLELDPTMSADVKGGLDKPTLPPPPGKPGPGSYVPKPSPIGAVPPPPAPPKTMSKAASVTSSKTAG